MTTTPYCSYILSLLHFIALSCLDSFLSVYVLASIVNSFHYQGFGFQGI
uniref:Uncharacterized protein n=1 Tax=Nelumbo nucifera TaxID=4432 RepID=A0A822Z0A9_NELNU|nr:TPA_asm: hypothetical protein HUJ06_007077 [Nelumbo nucifera]